MAESTAQVKDSDLDAEESNHEDDVHDSEDIDNDIAVVGTGAKKKKKKKKKKNKNQDAANGEEEEDKIIDNDTLTKVQENKETSALDKSLNSIEANDDDNQVAGQNEQQPSIPGQENGNQSISTDPNIPSMEISSSSNSSTTPSKDKSTPLSTINGSPSKHSPTDNSRLRPVLKANKKSSRNLDKSIREAGGSDSSSNEHSPPKNNEESSPEKDVFPVSLENKLNSESISSTGQGNNVSPSQQPSTSAPKMSNSTTAAPATSSTNANNSSSLPVSSNSSGRLTPTPGLKNSAPSHSIVAPSPTFSSDAHESDTDEEDYVGEFSHVVISENDPPPIMKNSQLEQSVDHEKVNNKDESRVVELQASMKPLPEAETKPAPPAASSSKSNSEVATKEPVAVDTAAAAVPQVVAQVGNVRSRASMFEKKSGDSVVRESGSNVGLFGRKESNDINKTTTSKVLEKENAVVVEASSASPVAVSTTPEKPPAASVSTPERSVSEKSPNTSTPSPNKLKEFMVRTPSGTVSSPKASSPSVSSTTTTRTGGGIQNTSPPSLVSIPSSNNGGSTNKDEKSQSIEKDGKGKGKEGDYFLKLSDDENIEDIEDEGEEQERKMNGFANGQETEQQKGDDKELINQSNSRVQSLIKKHSAYFEKKSSDNTSSKAGTPTITATTVATVAEVSSAGSKPSQKFGDKSKQVDKSKKVSSSPSWSSVQQKKRLDTNFPSPTPSTNSSTATATATARFSATTTPTSSANSSVSTPASSSLLNDTNTSNSSLSSSKTTPLSTSPSKLKPTFYPQRPTMAMEQKGSPGVQEEGGDSGDSDGDGSKKRKNETTKEINDAPKSSIHALRARFLRSQSPSPRAVLRPNRKKLAVEEEKQPHPSPPDSNANNQDGKEFEGNKTVEPSDVAGGGDDAGQDVKSKKSIKKSGLEAGYDSADQDQVGHLDEVENTVYADPEYHLELEEGYHNDDLFEHHENAFIGGGGLGRLGRSGSRKRSVATKQLHHSFSFNESAMEAREEKAKETHQNEVSSQSSGQSFSSFPAVKRAPAPLMRSASMGGPRQSITDDPHTAFKKLQFNTAESQRLQEAHERVRRKMLKAASTSGTSTVPSFARDASQQAISLINNSEQDKVRKQRALERAGIRTTSNPNSGGSSGGGSSSGNFSTPRQPQNALALPGTSKDEESVKETRLVKTSQQTPMLSVSSPFKAMAKPSPPSAFKNFRNQNQKSSSRGSGMKSSGMSNFFGSGSGRHTKSSQVYHEEDMLAKYENNAEAYNKRLEALESQKRELVKIEDYISAAAVKRQIDDLVMMIEDETRSKLMFSSVRAQPSSLMVRASIARLKVLEQAKRIAVEAEDYVKANILKVQISELQSLILSKHNKPSSPPKNGGSGGSFASGGGVGVSVNGSNGQRHRSRSGSNKNIKVKRYTNPDSSSGGGGGGNNFYRASNTAISSQSKSRSQDQMPVIKRTILRTTNTSLYSKSNDSASSINGGGGGGAQEDAASRPAQKELGSGTRMLLKDNVNVDSSNDGSVDRYDKSSFSSPSKSNGRSNDNKASNIRESPQWESPLKKNNRETDLEGDKSVVSNRAVRKVKEKAPTLKKWNNIRDAVFNAKLSRKKSEMEITEEQGGVNAIMQKFGDAPKRKSSTNSSSSTASASSNATTAAGGVATGGGRPMVKNAASIKERLNNFRSQSQRDQGADGVVNDHEGGRSMMYSKEQRNSFSESRLNRKEQPSEDNEPFWLKDFKAKHQGKPTNSSTEQKSGGGGSSSKIAANSNRGNFARMNKWGSSSNLEREEGSADRGMSLNRGMDFFKSNPDAVDMSKTQQRPSSSTQGSSAPRPSWMNKLRKSASTQEPRPSSISNNLNFSKNKAGGGGIASSQQEGGPDYEAVLKTSDRGAVVWDPASKRKILMKRPGSVSPALSLSSNSSNGGAGGSARSSPVPSPNVMNTTNNTNGFKNNSNNSNTNKTNASTPFQLVKLKSVKERTVPKPKENSSFTQFMKAKDEVLENQTSMVSSNKAVLRNTQFSDSQQNMDDTFERSQNYDNDDGGDEDMSIHLSQSSCVDALTASLVLSADDKKDMIEHDATFRKASIAVHAAQREENERTMAHSSRSKLELLDQTADSNDPSVSLNNDTSHFNNEQDPYYEHRNLSSNSVQSANSIDGGGGGGVALSPLLASPQSSVDSIISDLAASPSKASTYATTNRLMKTKNKTKTSLMGRRSNSMGEHSD